MSEQSDEKDTFEVTNLNSDGQTDSNSSSGHGGKRKGAGRPRKPTPGFFTPGHIACCQCGECLARRGVAGSNPDLVVTEGRATRGEGHMVYTPVDRKPEGVNYWDWYYERHPEETDHRTILRCHDAYPAIDLAENPVGSESYQRLVLTGWSSNGKAADEVGQRRAAEAPVSLGNDKYKAKRLGDENLDKLVDKVRKS